MIATLTVYVASMIIQLIDIRQPVQLNLSSLRLKILGDVTLM